MNYSVMKMLANDPTNGFFSVVQEYMGASYEIFNYRLCSYSDFFNDFNPHTLNMRGAMFRIDTEEPELVCLPMPKFFNIGENPSTMYLDMTTIVHIADKHDGSLISTFINPEGNLDVKSKGSLFSEQAVAARKELEKDTFDRREILKHSSENKTVDLEYCAPDNRIVLKYDSPTLIPLLIRDMVTGSVAPYNVFDDIDIPVSAPDLVEYIRGLKDIEGYVFHMADAKMVKIKTDWYVQRHRAKDNVFNLRNLAEIVFDENTDDLVQLFEDDQETIDHIRKYEKYFIDKFNSYYNAAFKFHQKNLNMERKYYAIKAKACLPSDTFGYAMSLYLGRDPIDKIKRNIIKDQPAFESVED